MERNHFGSGWNWMDCPGNYHLRWMESAARRVWGVSVRFLTVAWACASTQFAEYSLSGIASGAISAHDPYPVTGQHWRCRVGGTHSGRVAGANPAFLGQSVPDHARLATRRPRRTVRDRLAVLTLM